MLLVVRLLFASRDGWFKETWQFLNTIKHGRKQEIKVPNLRWDNGLILHSGLVQG